METFVNFFRSKSLAYYALLSAAVFALLAWILYFVSKGTLFASGSDSIGNYAALLSVFGIGVLIHAASLIAPIKWLKFIPIAFYIVALILMFDFEMVFITNVIYGLDKNKFDPIWITSLILWLLAIVGCVCAMVMRDRKK